MFKTILALAVVASAYLLTSDAKAQGIYWANAPANEVSCHDTPDLGRVCLTIPAQRLVQELPPGLLPDGRAARFVSALSLIQVEGRSPFYVSLTANCTDRRAPVQLADVELRPDGTRAVSKPEPLGGSASDRIVTNRARTVLCSSATTRTTH